MKKAAVRHPLGVGTAALRHCRGDCARCGGRFGRIRRFARCDGRPGRCPWTPRFLKKSSKLLRFCASKLSDCSILGDGMSVALAAEAALHGDIPGQQRHHNDADGRGNQTHQDGVGDGQL